MKKLLLFLQFMMVTFVYAQKNYPIPPGTENRLFYIQHNGNHNTYVYDANFNKDRKLRESGPVDIYRIIYTEGGVKKELTMTQRKFAYGLNAIRISENNYQLSLVSFPKMKLYLRVNNKGNGYVETTINNKRMILNRMFLQSKAGTSGLRTKLDYILFYGRDAFGKNISEKLIL